MSAVTTDVQQVVDNAKFALEQYQGAERRLNKATEELMVAKQDMAEKERQLGEAKKALLDLAGIPEFLWPSSFQWGSNT